MVLFLCRVSAVPAGRFQLPGLWRVRLSRNRRPCRHYLNRIWSTAQENKVSSFEQLLCMFSIEHSQILNYRVIGGSDIQARHSLPSLSD